MCVYVYVCVCADFYYAIKMNTQMQTKKNGYLLCDCTYEHSNNKNEIIRNIVKMF